MKRNFSDEGRPDAAPPLRPVADGQRIGATVHAPASESEPDSDSGRGDTPHEHLQDFFAYKIATLSNRFSLGTARIYAQRYDLTLRDWRVLNVLAHYAPLSANEVAEKILNDKTQVSRAVDKLVKRGFVTRAVDTENRRKSVLRITDEGRKVFEEINPIARQREADLVSVLSADEYREFLAMLDRLLTRVEDMGD